jgi:hypothetical protein
VSGSRAIERHSSSEARIQMSKTEMQSDDVERNATLLGLRIAPEHSQAIVSLLTEIRNNVLKKASALKDDAPLAVYFDAR